MTKNDRAVHSEWYAIAQRDDLEQSGVSGLDHDMRGFVKWATYAMAYYQCGSIASFIEAMGYVDRYRARLRTELAAMFQADKPSSPGNEEKV